MEVKIGTVPSEPLIVIQNAIKHKSELRVDPKTIEIFELLVATNMPFLQKINTELMAILDDHKINIVDIPTIVLVITDIATIFTKDLQKGKVTHGEMLHFITEFLILLIKSDLVTFDNEDLAIKIVHESARLVEKTLSLKKVYRCKWVFCC
jgi:hypothetical protein